MQRFAFIIFLIALLTVALASPLPVHVVQEARELVVELSVRDAPVNNQVLHREVNTDAQSDVNLSILAREHESSEDYLQEMTGGEKIARAPEDIEPRICRLHMCQ